MKRFCYFSTLKFLFPREQRAKNSDVCVAVRSVGVITRLILYVRNTLS